MNQVDFICSSTFEKAQYIWKKGEFIGGRTAGDYQLLLFYLPGFYAEVHYSLPGKRIENIELPDHDSFTESYLEKINISDLFRL